MQFARPIVAAATVFTAVLGWSVWTAPHAGAPLVVHAAGNGLDDNVAAAMTAAGFTGTIEASVEGRLGRRLDQAKADLGRLLFFDNVLGLREDNSCAGCHAPAFGFGDSQSVAIGVQNNGIVGADRTGPRNQRRSPMVLNTAFFPKLMLNGRFASKSGNPFDNSLGFTFPNPEGDAMKFAPGDARFPTLLSAQGIMPSTELVEMAGFTGAANHPLFSESPHLHQFDDGVGTKLPQDTNHTSFEDPESLNEEIRAKVLRRLQHIDGYLLRFAEVFNAGVTAGFAIQDWMIGQALSEFQTTLTFANAPADRFARGERGAMTRDQKQGALVFFGKGRCIDCHSTAGPANEMFSNFGAHVLGVPQVAAVFGAGSGNVPFDGPGADEDFGVAQFTGRAADRYRFRTAPLRNVAMQAAFFHNGAFLRLEDAIRHHLDVAASQLAYDAANAGLDPDLRHRRGPDVPLDLVDARLSAPIALSAREFANLLAFVRDGLLDPRARRENLCGMVPAHVPSGLPVARFQGC